MLVAVFGETGSVGFPRICMARWMAFKPGVPRLPPGAFMGVEIRDG